MSKGQSIQQQPEEKQKPYGSLGGMLGGLKKSLSNISQDKATEAFDKEEKEAVEDDAAQEKKLIRGADAHYVWMENRFKSCNTFRSSGLCCICNACFH